MPFINPLLAVIVKVTIAGLLAAVGIITLFVLVMRTGTEPT
jgi:hypothetical protein